MPYDLLFLQCAPGIRTQNLRIKSRLPIVRQMLRSAVACPFVRRSVRPVRQMQSIPGYIAVDFAVNSSGFRTCGSADGPTLDIHPAEWYILRPMVKRLVEIDDSLLAEARRVAGTQTIKATVEAGLRRLVETDLTLRPIQRLRRVGALDLGALDVARAPRPQRRG